MLLHANTVVPLPSSFPFFLPTSMNYTEFLEYFSPDETMNNAVETVIVIGPNGEEIQTVTPNGSTRSVGGGVSRRQSAGLVGGYAGGGRLGGR